MYAFLSLEVMYWWFLKDVRKMVRIELDFCEQFWKKIVRAGGMTNIKVLKKLLLLDVQVLSCLFCASRVFPMLQFVKAFVVDGYVFS